MTAQGTASIAGDALRRLGMSEAGATSAAARYAQCDAALNALSAAGDRVSLWVPGRVELLGKHTDYAGGRSLLCTIERGFAVRLAPRRDATIRAVDVGRGEHHATRMAPDATGRPTDWTNYVGTVARRIARDFPDARRGVDIAFASDLPSAAGLSSSTVLVVAVALALLEANGVSGTREFTGLFPSPESLAAYLGAVESGAPWGAFKGDEGVGTHGGSQDHTAVLCCAAGSVSQFAFAPVRREGVFPFLDDCSLVIGVSGVTANKTGAARDRYNRLSRAVSHLVRRWNADAARSDASLAAAIASAPGAADRLRTLCGRAADAEFPELDLRNRLEQFLEEAYVLVPAAADAFRRGAAAELGTIVDRSQHLAESLLGNQVPETVALQRLAREHGAVAASAFGAGFGGSVWALVPTAEAGSFVTEWSRAYRASHAQPARRSSFFLSPAGPHADRW